MLAEKGHRNDRRNHDEDVAPTVSGLPSRSTKARNQSEKINIQGNRVFSARQIKRSMKLVKEISPLTVLTSKDTYYDLKLADDIHAFACSTRTMGSCEPIFRIPSWKQVEGGVPHTSFDEAALAVWHPLPFWKKKVNRFYITLKIEETTIKSGRSRSRGKGARRGRDQARARPRSRQIYNETALRKGFENLRKVYGARGYVNFTPTPVQDLDERKSCQPQHHIDEDRQFTVHRINITGNTKTRDRVIRREVLVEEAGLQFDAVGPESAAAQSTRLLRRDQE